MKKILALILSVLMIATAFCAVIPASAAADIGTIVNRHDFYVGEAKEEGTNDITDGTIETGEYTFSWTLSSTAQVAYGTYLIGTADVLGAPTAEDEITLHMAHDETYVYIAVESNDASDSKQRPYNVLITRPHATTYGEMMDRINITIDKMVDGTFFGNGTNQVTQYQYTRYLNINEDGTQANMKMPVTTGAGNCPPAGEWDAYVTFDNANDKGLLEFKITKEFIKTCFGIDTLDQVGLAVQHRIDGSSNGGGDLACYFSELHSYATAQTLKAEYELSSTVTPSWTPYAMNLTTGVNTDPGAEPEEPEEPVEPKTLAEIVNFQNYYVGGQVATAPAIDDGVISAGEYTFAQALSTDMVFQMTSGTYFGNANDMITEGRAATDNIKLYMASDADYIYIAMESRRQNAGTNKNFFTIALTQPNPETYGEMMSRVRFRMTVTPDVGGDPKQSSFAYTFVNPVTDTGAQSQSTFAAAQAVEAYATITADYTGITEMKISKAMLAASLGCDKSVFDEGVGLALQQMFYNYKSSGVAYDASLPYGEVGCSYLQALTTEQKIALAENFGLTGVNNWAPLMMNFGDAGIDTRNGASVRISEIDGRTGLRFKTVFDKAYVEALTASATEWSVGTIILPADTLNGTAVTHEALDAASIKYLDIPATYESPYASDANTVTIAGSIVGIKEANLDRDFAAIGYIYVDGTYYYSDSGVTTRNVKTVATIALGDLKAIETAEYANLVSEGIYSPYTEAQRVILSKLNGTYEEVVE